jgi:hypothetical protein
MTARDGRQLIERVLDHLIDEHAMANELDDWLASLQACETCAAIIRNWNRQPHARKVAA